MLPFLKTFKNAERLYQSVNNPPVNIHGDNNKKEAPYITLRLKASLTLEATLVMPLFLAAIIAFMFFIQVMEIQTRLQKALYNQEIKTSGYAYFADSLNMSDQVEQMFEACYVRTKVVQEVGKDFLDNSYIAGGSSGIYVDMLEKGEDGRLKVNLYYEMKVPYNLFNLPNLKLSTCLTCHTWTGEEGSDEEKEDKEIVYMTSNGTVYHLYKDCSYLVSAIYEKDISRIDLTKYSPCSVCCKNLIGNPTKVYYTQYGERYHVSSTCGNLHSGIYSIEKSVAEEKYSVCSRCSDRSKNG